uniref:Bactericidal permeability-increasing protein n=1 Tax=Melopsittacus undulatus TaxID=13146 RepID=A0A8C6IPR8_MELUD
MLRALSLLFLPAAAQPAAALLSVGSLLLWIEAGTHGALWFTVTAKIDAMAGIDYSLVAPPAATAQSLDVDLKGEFFSLAHRSAIPFPPLALALPPDHDRMVYFGASSYFFNTASVAYHAAGALVLDITNSMIPKDVEFHLNTSTFSAFVPQVSAQLCLPIMKVRLSAPSAPFLTIRPDGLSLRPVVDIQTYAILPNSTLAPLFLLSLVRMLQSIMNVLASNILLPRLNGEDLLWGWGAAATHVAPSKQVQLLG